MTFAEVLRSSARLRGTFDRVSGFSLWWRIVLSLHGKPAPDGLTPVERTAVLTRGFRFYGRLYRGLGLLLLLGAGLCLADSSRYWSAVSAFGALYLIAVSALAFQGARRFAEAKSEGSALLVTFFASIIVFLAAFGALVSSWARGGGLNDLANAALLAAFILFGIGSYLLELLYLFWWEAGREAR